MKIFKNPFVLTALAVGVGFLVYQVLLAPIAARASTWFNKPSTTP